MGRKCTPHRLDAQRSSSRAAEGRPVQRWERERSNRPAAANRAEETWCHVAKWKVAPRKTDLAMVRNARGLAWSWVTSSTLVNRLGGSCRRIDIPFERVSKTTFPMRRHLP